MSVFIGKYVRLRNGEIRGPIKEREGKNSSTESYPLTDGDTTWTADGNTLTGDRATEWDIISAYNTLEAAKSIGGQKHPFFVNTDDVVLTEKASHGRIYLAGPMTGYPDLNYPAFHRAAKALRDLGYEVYNPAEYEGNGTDEFPLREAFTEYVNYILNRADIIALLPGHENSVGATAELSLARVVKLKEIYL